MDKSPLGRLSNELLETILLALPLKNAIKIDVLCRELEAIVKASPRLQQALFIKPKPSGTILEQEWVDERAADEGRDFRVRYSHADGSAAPAPRANPFLPTWAPPAMINDVRHVGHRIEWEMVAALEEHASLRYMFVTQPPMASLQLWGRVGARGDGKPTGLMIRVRDGVRIGHVMHAMEKFGEGAFVMMVGSREWAR